VAKGETMTAEQMQAVIERADAVDSPQSAKLWSHAALALRATTVRALQVDSPERRTLGCIMPPFCSRRHFMIR
jgi:hypothetical protein